MTSMTNTVTDTTSSGHDEVVQGPRLFAFRVRDKYAILNHNPENTGKKVVILVTKDGRRILFRASPVARGDKVLAFFPEGNPPIMLRCEEILEQEPEGMLLLELPVEKSGTIKTWLGIR
ncbi:hypothetical protein [Methanoregula sp.]|uniref:hypothetical protein n=1 Tax=Methanoregula sp. TaxID=2052170 RepID=UPI00262C6C53|nr:hypothetical protein [Methanoregula sp.]MDD5142789.1 hypothetical protein [Methanoregula sp.]